MIVGHRFLIISFLFVAAFAMTLSNCSSLNNEDVDIRPAEHSAARDLPSDGGGEEAPLLQPVAEAPSPAPTIPEADVQESKISPPPREERTQFVLLSLDTTPNARQPLESTGFYALYKAINRGRDPSLPPNSLTFFIISGGMQFDPARRRLSEEEEPFRGVVPEVQPIIEYADELDTIRGKAANIRGLHELGVEIGSHTVRHSHCADWSEKRWRFELRDNQRILDLLDIPHPMGFRAPFLEWNENLFPVLEELGMTYDASNVGGRSWPTRHPGTQIWVFGIPSVNIPGGRRVLFFDTNMEVTLMQAAGRAGITGGEPVRQWIDDAFYRAGYNEFENHYNGNRAPFLISGHGGFRIPMIRLMRRVCGLPMVRCSTFREAAEYMSAHPELEGVRDYRLGEHSDP